MQDTYFLPDDFKLKGEKRREDESFILRPHTSSVQIRTMTKRKPPVRILSPGRCFRRDTVDATHSANFHQVEGLYVDSDVTIRDLKALLDHFVRELFGSDAKTRFRPSFFPLQNRVLRWMYRPQNSANSVASGSKLWAAAWSTQTYLVMLAMTLMKYLATLLAWE